MKTLLLLALCLSAPAAAFAQAPNPGDKPTRNAPMRTTSYDPEPLYVEPLAVQPASQQVLDFLDTTLQLQTAQSRVTLEPLCAQFIKRDLVTLTQESAAAGLSPAESENLNEQFLREVFDEFQRPDSANTSWSAAGRAYGEADYTPIIGRIFTPTPIIVITTTPPDAQVELLTPQGPRPLGKTALRKPLDCGKYRLTFSKPGYQSVTKTLVARRYPREQNITLKLQK